ncbi:MAG: glutamate-1-semialdehyde 2,1-aminomutase [Pontimonas sp.]
MTNVSLSESWHARAQHSIPGGVSSPVRAFSAVGGTPRYFVEGKGSKVIDVDGNDYVDFVGSWGPMILGHAHPAVVEAVTRVAQSSFSFGAPHSHEVLLAEEIISRVEPVDRVRFVSSGTEAVMTAIRLARAATGRNIIIKFAGCYHGHLDSMLVAAGSGVATLGMADSPGVTPGQVEDTLVLTYNDVAGLAEAFATHGANIAAVITESAAANMGVVPPSYAFTQAIFELSAAAGALVILDEVMTGFRVSEGGWWKKFLSAKGWKPQLFTFGKVIGGGLPLAAVGGAAEVMDLLAPLGPVYQAGTLSGNPVATIAGLETLRNLDSHAYERLDDTASRAGNIVSQALRECEVEHTLQTAGNLFSIFFTAHSVTNFDQAKSQSTQNFATFFHALLDHGVSAPPSAFESWFVSAAHTSDDLERLTAAATHAAQQVASSQEWRS